MWKDAHAEWIPPAPPRDLCLPTAAPLRSVSFCRSLLNSCADGHSKALLKFCLEPTSKIIERRGWIQQVTNVFKERCLQLVEEPLREADYSRTLRAVGILGKPSRLKIQYVLNAIDSPIQQNVRLMQNAAAKS